MEFNIAWFYHFTLVMRQQNVIKNNVRILIVIQGLYK